MNYLDKVGLTHLIEKIKNIIPTKTSQLTNDSNFITNEEETDPTVSDAAKSIVMEDIYTWDNKQESLVSGTNIKTINHQSLLGNGNITIVGADGATDYNTLDNLPSVNNVTLIGNKTLDDLGIPTKASDLTNDMNWAVTNADNNFSESQTINGDVKVTSNLVAGNSVKVGHFGIILEKDGSITFGEVN